LPVGWQFFGYLLLAMLVAGGAFLAASAYARVITVAGVIVPDEGVAAVVPSRAGVLTELRIREGTPVEAGTPIARIRVTETLGSGGAASEQLASALATQERNLEQQTDALGLVSDQELARRREQVRGLEQELTELGVQLDLQRQLVESARENLERTNGAAGRGFISRRDVLAREEALMVRRQQLAQLEQSRAAKQAGLADVRREIARLDAQRLATGAEARLRLAELSRQRVEAAAADGYLVTAPIGGFATAVTARVGQTVDSSSPIASVIPARSPLRAELLVPASAIGFIRAGQEVQLSIDGYPAEQFGSVDAVVLTVPRSPVSRRDSNGNTVSAYPSTCEIRNTGRLPHGAGFRLVAGMTLVGHIVTRRQSLLAWLLEPLLSVAAR
jgi:membrane fusion protein